LSLNYFSTKNPLWGSLSYFNYLKAKLSKFILDNSFKNRFFSKFYTFLFSSQNAFHYFLNYFRRYSKIRYLTYNKISKRDLSKKIKRLTNIFNKIYFLPIETSVNIGKRSRKLMLKKIPFFKIFPFFSFNNIQLNHYLTMMKNIIHTNLLNKFFSFRSSGRVHLFKRLPLAVSNFLLHSDFDNLSDLDTNIINKINSNKFLKRNKYTYLSLSKKISNYENVSDNIINRFDILNLNKNDKVFDLNDFDNLRPIIKDSIYENDIEIRNSKMLRLFKKTYRKKFTLTKFSNVIYTKFNPEENFTNSLKHTYLTLREKKKSNLIFHDNSDDYITHSSSSKIRFLFVNFFSLLTRMIYLLLLKRRITFYLMNFFTFKTIHLYIIPTKHDISAYLFVQFMVLKFLQRFKLKEIMNSIINYLDRMSYSLRMHNGYRVMILGRFNRRVRITYY
jgi:hypothetical protein